MTTMYYLPEYTDEGGEFVGSLATIASHLTDETIGLNPKDGQTFAATQEVLAYVACHCTAAGYVIPENLPGDLLALAFTEGQGWTADMMCATREEAAELLLEFGDEDVEYLACSVAREEGTITFRRNPDRCEWSATT
jgi:hypothetical protein